MAASQKNGHIPQGDAAADAREWKDECHYRGRSCGREEPTGLAAKLPYPLRLVEAEQVKHGRPGDRQRGELENVFHRDARRKETLRVTRELREIDANEDNQYGCECSQTVEAGDKASVGDERELPSTTRRRTRDGGR
jgi:hypothetical protein